MTHYHSGSLIFIMWVSWAGKNTILHLLTERNHWFKQVISYKTRPLRPLEVNHVDYHYMSNEDFQKSIEQGVFLEYATLHWWQYYYGTKRSDIIDWLQAWDIILKEIDMQWIESMAQHHHELYQESFRVFLDLSDESMIRRITSRAPISDEELAKRLHSATKERQLAKEYASVIISAEWTIEEVYQSVITAIQQFLKSGRAVV